MFRAPLLIVKQQSILHSSLSYNRRFFDPFFNWSFVEFKPSPFAMSIKLWGSVTSACTHRVLITLNELGLKYDLTQINLMKGEQKNPIYVKERHPFGRIPVIQDGDLQLFESRAICRYLVTKYGGPSSPLDAVASGDPVKIAKFEKALSIDYSYFDPSVKTLCNEKLWKNPAEPANPLEEDKATTMFKIALDYYEDFLGSNAYLAGNDFSLTDVHVFTWMPYIKLLGLYEEIAARPKVEDLWKRVSSRSAWKSALKDMPQ
ncbi:putative glutathione S-transferase [Colletotrichum scovillei]|nr:putative glutathione S-transferase [Colletotrichum scovillei]